MNPPTPPTNPTGPTARVALVTGGAKRVGTAVAVELARAGFDVAITYLTSADDAHQTVNQIQQLGRRAMAIKANLAKPDAADQVYAAFIEHFDRLDALINNASSFTPSPLGLITPEQFDQSMAVNARAPLMLIQRFADMLGSHYDPELPGENPGTGRIVNFIDIHVLGEPLKGYIAYNAAKAALKEITQTAAAELAPRVTVNAIAPGVVAWADSYSDQMKQDYMQRVPLARPGTPQDAAAAVRYLICDAHYTTGQILKLDGGRSLT